MKTNIIIKTGTPDEFFSRGRQLSKNADRGDSLASERILSFEDPADLMRLMSNTRLDLFRAVKVRPGSITDIAARLNRDRSAVKRDVDALERAGLVTVTDRKLPGHGRMKEVRAAARRFRLQAEIV
jgi:predicted transcriptional regulator